MVAPTHPLLMPRAVGPTGPRFAAARFALAVALALLGVLALASRAPALEQKLTATSVNLGYSVAVDGDTLVLGDPLDSAGVGAVYVFRRSGDSWANTARLTASDGSAGDVLGVSVAIEGDTIVAGASGDGVQQNANGQGSVYKLTAPASVTFAIERTAPGRLVTGRCRTPTRANATRRHCTRVTARATVTRSGKTGANHFVLHGQIRRLKLGAGHYRLIATPTAAGRTGRQRTVPFRIVR
jgi:FG-GAP repeat